MTTDEINRVIGELYGWQADYCGDLNAMHEAEMSILDSFAKKYMNQLLSVCATPTPVSGTDERRFYCASARHRAEAFLRVMGKWEEVAE